MSDDAADQAIPGAPNWVQDFLSRIEKRDEVRDAKESEVHERMFKAVGDLSEQTGQIAASLAKVESKFEYLRTEMRNTRDEVALQTNRIVAVEKELYGVTTEIEKLGQKVRVLEGDIRELKGAGETP